MGRHEERPAWQREACATAAVDGGMTSSEVVAAAKAGTLTPEQGAFDVGRSTVDTWALRLRRRRAGKAKSESDSLPAAQLQETLRRRLLRVVEHEIAKVEKEQRKASAAPIDGERLRQLARALREAAAIPEVGGRPPVKPGQRDPEQGGKLAGGPTRGGIAGAILRDASTAPQPHPQHTHIGDSDDTPHHEAHESDSDHGETSDSETSSDEDGSSAAQQQARSPVSEAREKVALALGGLGTGDAAQG